MILFSVRALIYENGEKYEYSSFLLLVFLGASLALMKENAYPARVFVGDTYCYFAGIVFAIAAMFSNNYLKIGETSIVCQFLFLPQLINFLYSIPQLFGLYECPRHRLTVYDAKTDKLTPIRTNMNLLNLSLRILGPTNEGVLCDSLLIFQGLCSVIGVVLGAYFV